MPWGRIDDTAYDHEKLRVTSLQSVGVYFLALSFCNRHLTDGLVTRESLRLIRATKVHAKELVARGLWEEDPRGYRVHDFLQDGRNKSREQVLAERANAAERQRRAREAAAMSQMSQGQSRRDVRRESQGSHGVSHGVTSEVVTGPPSRPVPSYTRPLETSEVSEPREKRTNGLPPSPFTRGQLATKRLAHDNGFHVKEADPDCPTCQLAAEAEADFGAHATGPEGAGAVHS